jgi:hypothetical protein
MSDCSWRPSVVLLLAALAVSSGSAQDGAGALRIRLDQTACRAADSIELVRVTTRPDGSGGHFTNWVSVGHSLVTADCAWSIEAVGPGEYEVWFQHTSIKLAVRPVTIGPGQTVDVALTNDVLVTGSVLLNGAPFRGIAVEFAQYQGSHRLLAEAVTDSTGSYQVFLADESPFTVVFSREKAVVLGQDQEGVAHRGVNQMDWLLEGATLRVMPVNWDRKQPLSLWIERMDHTGQTYGQTVAVQADSLPLTLAGLGWGTYEIRWVESGELAHRSQTIQLAINEQNREPSLQLAVALQNRSMP